MGWMTGVRFPVGLGFFLLSGREADYSPPHNAEVMNMWSYTCPPQYVFMARYLVKHRDNFTVTSAYVSITDEMRSMHFEMRPTESERI
jgi:hypothetical protein